MAGVRVGLLPGTGFVVNPTVAQMAASRLDLMMAGTREAVLMIEGFCDFLSEEEMLQVRLCARGLSIVRAVIPIFQCFQQSEAIFYELCHPTRIDSCDCQ